MDLRLDPRIRARLDASDVVQGGFLDVARAHNERTCVMDAVFALARVVERHQRESDALAITIVSRIQALQGRFAMLLKAPDGAGLLRAQQWLDLTVNNLAVIPYVLTIDDRVAQSRTGPIERRGPVGLPREDLGKAIPWPKT